MLLIPRSLVARFFRSVYCCCRDYSNATTPITEYPKCIKELEAMPDRVLSYGAELEADHPGFTDKAYRVRRDQISKLAKQYRFGMEFPRVVYNRVERDTWKAVYNELTRLYPLHACEEYLAVFSKLQQEAGYSADNIPQLSDISYFLNKETGFTLRPTSGLLSPRGFLNSLAFRVFNSTQYLRHHSKPLYTPEPDLIHECLGHVPLLANKDFADFSYEIGKRSLRCNEEELTRLGAIYWYTIEFGLLEDKHNSRFRAYGAGLLSSPGELGHSMSLAAKRLPFKASTVANTPCSITHFQNSYYHGTSLKATKEDVLRYLDETVTKHDTDLVWDREREAFVEVKRVE